MSNFSIRNAQKDFSKATIKALAARNIRIVGVQAIPADANDVYFSGTGYALDNNGCGMIRTFTEVLKLAAA